MFDEQIVNNVSSHAMGNLTGHVRRDDALAPPEFTAQLIQMRCDQSKAKYHDQPQSQVAQTAVTTIDGRSGRERTS